MQCIKLAVAVLGLAALAGCQTTGSGNYTQAPQPLQQTSPGGISNQTIGLASGALVGGVLGNKFGKGKGKTAMTALGALAGAAVGSGMGAASDARNAQARLEADQRYIIAAAHRALESGENTGWHNPQTGSHGMIEPREKAKRSDGVVCRDYILHYTSGGNTSRDIGAGCKKRGQEWKLS